MTNPAAALTSELLVRKGSARPLGLEPIERTPDDVVKAVRPALVLVTPDADSSAATDAPHRRTGRDPWARLIDVWTMAAERWGVPTILFVAGVAIVAAVAVSGTGSVAENTSLAAPFSRPLGPTPVTWVDNGLLANPALSGR